MSNEYIKNELVAESLITARNEYKVSLLSCGDTSVSSMQESPNEAVERL